jgi:hypothetical protein
MRIFLAAVLAGAGSLALAQEQEIQRALIQRDQQSAEFAARTRGADTMRLEQLHARQLLDAMARPVQPELRPYERQKMADERVLVFPPPAVTAEKPREERLLPLPGRSERLIDPVPAQDPRH